MTSREHLLPTLFGISLMLGVACSSSDTAPQQTVGNAAGGGSGGATGVAGSAGTAAGAGGTVGLAGAAGSGGTAGSTSSAGSVGLAGAGGIAAGGAAGAAGNGGAATGGAGGSSAGGGGAGGGSAGAGSGGATISAGGVAGGTGPNLALNKPATASSVEQGDHAAVRINDGDAVTRWVGVMAVYPQWNQIDLQASYSIDTVIILPYMSRAYQFVLEGSLDGVTYFTLADETANTAGDVALTVSFPAQSTQFVRITISGASGYALGWSAINEMQIFQAP